MNINLSEKLYNRLPRVYRQEDGEAIPTPYPLKRFLNILGEGLNEVEGYIDNLTEIYDIDNCPPELLPLIGETLGVSVPINNSMTVELQRKFLKAVPALLRMKGTEDSYKYLTRELFGSEAKATVYTNEYDSSMTLDEWEKLKAQILVRIEADGELGYIAENINSLGDSFNDYAEIIRTANRRLITQFALYYRDKYDLYDNFDDFRRDDVIRALNEEYIKTAEGIYLPSNLTEVKTELYDITRLQTDLTDRIMLRALVDQYQRLMKTNDTSNLSTTKEDYGVDLFNRIIEGDTELPMFVGDNKEDAYTKDMTDELIHSLIDAMSDTYRRDLEARDTTTYQKATFAVETDIFELDNSGDVGITTRGIYVRPPSRLGVTGGAKLASTFNITNPQYLKTINY